MSEGEYGDLSSVLLEHIAAYTDDTVSKSDAKKLVAVSNTYFLPDKNLECEFEFGEFSWSRPDVSYNKLVDSIEDFVASGLYHVVAKGNLGSLFDYVFVYTEKDFCDRDGAGIIMNVNSESFSYRRLIVYESFDDEKFTPLPVEYTLEKVIDMARGFIPKESKRCEDTYFVSYLSWVAT